MASQCSPHLRWIKLWIETFWSYCSDTRCWLTWSEYLSTCGICCTKNQKAAQHLETCFAVMASQCSGHLCWIMPWMHTFWSYCSNRRCWLTNLNTFNLRNMLYQGPEGFSTPRKPVLALQQVNVLPIYAESNYE